MKKLILAITISLVALAGYSQSTNDILNLLIENKTITQTQADSIRADAAIKQQEIDAKKKSFPIGASKAIQLSGYTHIRFQDLQEKGKPDAIDIRRARLDLKGTINPYWGYRLQYDFGGGSKGKGASFVAYTPKLLDAFAEWKPFDFLILTAGQFNIPISLENLTSDKVLSSINRSQVVEAFTARSKDVIGDNNGRDIGIQVSGSILKFDEINLFEYKIGLFEGQGINKAEDKNQFKDIAGRLVIHPLKGIDIGGSFYHGEAWYGKTGVDDPAAKNHLRNRFGFDANIEYKNASLTAEYLNGTDSSRVSDGYYIQAGYFVIPQQLQLLAKYDSYHNFKSYEYENAAVKDKPTKSNFNDIILGLNYIISSNSRIQASYTLRYEENDFVRNNFFLVQLQIGF